VRSTDGKPHTVESGKRLGATTVVVQFVDYQESPGDTDAAGAPVSFVHVVGEGEAWILAEGRVVKGRWAKPASEAITSFKDAGGSEVALRPGAAWVELVPTGSPAKAE
jgi:hypothetical protein